MDQDRNAQTKPAAEPRAVAPFVDSPTPPARPITDVGRFAPRRLEDDVEVQQGMDLAAHRKIIFVIGRGKTGKTTLLRWMAEKALAAGREFLMADIDPTNASFSSYFPDVSRPDGYDPAAVRAWLLRFINYAVEQNRTAIIDLGGGDTALRSLLEEMPTIFAEIEAAGLAPVAFYMSGPQPDDLAPIVTLSSHGFKPAARAIVFNEGLGEAGQQRVHAFAEVCTHPVVTEELTEHALVLWMPRLFAAGAVENRRSTFADARDGKTEVSLNMFDRTRVRAWLDAMDRRFAGVTSWLP
jgi:hypothetical protein